MRLNARQQARLEEEHKLFFLEDERIALNGQPLQFDPACIEGIVCNFFFQHNAVADLPRLRHVQLTSAGLDRVPVEEMKERNIRLFNAGAAYALPMAEWAVGKILEMYKCSAFFARNAREHRWEKNREIRELSGMAAAIVGFGNVGRCIAKRLRAFDVSILAVDIVEDASGLSDEWYPVSALGKALEKTDIVVLTLPLMASTYHILDDKMLARMKEDAVLVNVARGPLIDEGALLEHLNRGRFWGVALDVFEKEPLDPASALWACGRVILTPHNSFVGTGNQERLFQVLLSNLKYWKEGKQ